MKINLAFELRKTNPIKPNLVRHSLGEGGFKRQAFGLVCRSISEGGLGGIDGASHTQL